MLKEHPNFEQELKRLAETLEEVHTAYDTYSELLQFYKARVTEYLREFKGNPDEGSQLYIDLMTGTEFIKQYEEKITGLERSKDKPYFARIDFTPENGNEVEKCYIGKTGLIRDTDQYPMIIDWRAPVSTLYYEGRIGEASYFVPDVHQIEDQTIEGNLSLKRQFTIEDGNLQDIFDIDITTNDPLLQKALGANADNRLKDIASTIQGEQNRIIRANMKQPLIVQGVAGSGKTTIALHRIAYLIYNFESVFTPDSFMIIAPNNLFLDYISEVLPELGVNEVKQTTFIDFMLEFLEDETIKLTNPNKKLTSFVNLKDDEEVQKYHHMLKGVSKFKGSLTFKKVIDKYLNDIEENFIPREDLMIDEITLMHSSDIRSIFLSEYRYYPIYKRIHKLKKRLKKEVKGKVFDLIDKERAKIDKVVEQYYLSGSKSDQDREKILFMIEKRDERIKRWEKEYKKLVDRYLANIPNKSLMDYYQELITDSINLEIYTLDNVPGTLLDHVSDYSKQILDSGQVELEDLAPLVYLNARLFGLNQRLNLNHVVIDEAQDFSLFQYYLIRKLSRTDSFTILGDLSQGIHSYRAITNWDDVMKGIFPKIESNYTTLTKSYRTTIEIMNLANEVIKHYPDEKILAEPIIRHGDHPIAYQADSADTLITAVSEEILKIQQHGEINTIAVVGKTMEECKQIYNLFPEDLKPQLITDDMTEYSGGLIILPSYLTKGLEFDAVFVITLDETYGQEELDIKLLYIAMTRALHKLYVYSIGELSPLLTKVSDELLQRNQLSVS